MTKMKTKKAVSKKFKLTATGKLKFSRPGRRHKLTHKTGKRKRQLGNAAVLSETKVKTYKKMMCVE